MLTKKDFRYFFTIGLSLIVILTSCKFDSKNNEQKQEIIADTTQTIESEIKDSVEVLTNENIDTLTIQDRKLIGDVYHSHIKLEFAEVKNEKIDSNHMHVFEGVCAVSVIPDTIWINAQQEELGNDWNEIVSDNVYYEGMARDTLEKIGIPSMFASRDKKYIQFIKSDNSSFTVDLTKMEDAWGLILFNGNDNPVLWSNTDIETEIKEIFNK